MSAARPTAPARIDLDIIPAPVEHNTAVMTPRALTTLAGIAALSTSLLAQWPNHPDPSVPRDAKGEVNLNANIEGWKRLEPAQKWLNEHFSTASLEERQRFETYVNAQRVSGNALASEPRPQGDALFQEFLNWKRTRKPQ